MSILKALCSYTDKEPDNPEPAQVGLLDIPELNVSQSSGSKKGKVL